MPTPSSSPPRPRFLLAASVLGAALLFSPLARAGPGQGHKNGRGHGKKLDRVCQKLECSDAQRQELAAAFKELRTDIKPDREAMRALGEQLAGEFAKKKPDEKAMKAIYRKMDAHRSNIRERTHEAFMEVHASLSTDQRRKLAQMMAKKH